MNIISRFFFQTLQKKKTHQKALCYNALLKVFQMYDDTKLYEQVKMHLYVLWEDRLSMQVD